MKMSNTEVLAVAKWMVRKRLIETMCEPDAPEALRRLVSEDFADLVEAGAAEFAEAACSPDMEVEVAVHADGCRFTFSARASETGVSVDGRSECHYAW